MSKGLRVACFLAIVLFVLPVAAQYNGDLPLGFLGLESRTQAPPGIYVRGLLRAYPTSTIKDDSGSKINQQGSPASTLDSILIGWVSN
jgi:hypothetical protein